MNCIAIERFPKNIGLLIGSHSKGRAQQKKILISMASSSSIIVPFWFQPKAVVFQ